MPITQTDILALFDRVMPEWYLDSLKSPGPGYELLQAYAKMIERISQAVENDLDNGAFIMQAEHGSRATGTVLFSRPTFTAGAVTVKAGSLVKTSRGGRLFLITSDAVFGPTDLGPISATVSAVANGWEWNVPGKFISPKGEVVPGEINTIVLPLLAPPFGDQTITVAQDADTTGGAGAMLDQLGVDRGIPRSSSGEPDPNYRLRIRTLPDVVSPDAIIRQANNYVRTYVPTYDAADNFIETWDIHYQTCWFGPPVVEGGTSGEQPGAMPITHGFNPNLFTYDDNRPSPPFNDRWMDDDDSRGTFILVVPALPAIADTGMAWNDTALNSADLQTANGRRAVGAWDVPLTLINTELQGGWDGTDLQKQAFYKGLYDLLQNIKAGGVLAVVELAGE